jgi:predicted small lipoprotein YifL
MKTPVLVVALAALTGCGRTVPLRIGPADLVADVASYEVRVWQTGACPTIDAAGAAPDTRQIAVRQSYVRASGTSAAVGEVPSGVHAVSVLARDASCTALLFGCTPNVDFGSATSVDVVWSVVSPTFGCASGEACVASACVPDRATLDAGAHD